MRGFSLGEFQNRCARAQNVMSQHGIDALLLTTEPEVRYFTGFLTRFWESPTRPWFIVLPAHGNPIAVIPSIGRSLMQTTWVTDIRCWASPDLSDDGTTLLAETLREIVPRNGKIGIPDGHETHIRMPRADLERLALSIEPQKLASDHGIMRQLRMIKSDEEISKIETACTIAGRAFARVPDIAQDGVPLERVFRHFQMLCLEEGADYVPYLAGGAGANGYADVISPAGNSALCEGDVLMLDTGLVFDGYFCDYDRNWSVGPPSQAVREAHSQLIEATEAGAETARAGATASDVFAAMNALLSKKENATDAGRLGHGLGMSLTEWPSLIADDHTVLQAGMVLTLEPSITVDHTDNRLLVHEENILITDGAPRFLSPKVSGDIMRV